MNPRANAVNEGVRNPPTVVDLPECLVQFVYEFLRSFWTVDGGMPRELVDSGKVRVKPHAQHPARIKHSLLHLEPPLHRDPELSLVRLELRGELALDLQLDPLLIAT